MQIEDLHWKWSLVKFIGMRTFQSSCQFDVLFIGWTEEQGIEEPKIALSVIVIYSPP